MGGKQCKLATLSYLDFKCISKQNGISNSDLFVCVGPGNSSDGSPIFQGVSSSPRGGVGTSLPGLTGGIPTRAWDRGGKQTFLTPRPVLS